MSYNPNPKIGTDRPRLLPQIIDEIAHHDPSRPLIFMPKSSRPEHGWAPVTYERAANGINSVAHVLSEKTGQPSAGSFPTIAYIGPNDVRYILFMLGAVKAGYKALMVSPRNTEEAQLHLFDATDCYHIWQPASHATLVQTWLQKRAMISTMMPDLAVLLDTPVPHFPYDKTLEEAETDPLVVLHTSGTTGMPKAIVSRHGLWATLDEFQQWPEFHGTRVSYTVWAERASRVFLAFPFFHAGGLQLFVNLTLQLNTPCVLPFPGQPMNGELVRHSLLSSGADGAALPSSILEELSESEDGISTLLAMKWISFGGGSMATEVGDRLARRGVMLSNSLGSTEFGLYPFYFLSDPNLWQYFLLNTAQMCCEFRPFEGTEDGVYELVAVRHDLHDRHKMARVFYTFPSLTEWSTRDIFKPHPSLPDHWRHCGRVDDVIVFSTGEKLNPTSIEDAVSSHPLLKGALVVGQGRFQAAIILEPINLAGRKEGDRNVAEEIWPLIQEANSRTVAYGRIAREFVMVTSPEKPLPRAAKGSIHRALTIKLYKNEINALYGCANINTASAPALDGSSVASLAESIRHVFIGLGSAPLDVDMDFFLASVDSLVVANATRVLRAGLAAVGLPSNITTSTLYSYSTSRKLASHLLSTDRVSPDAAEHKMMKHLLAQHTQSFPPNIANKPPRNSHHQAVLLTGSTGNLGSYLLNALLACPRVTKVFALNRDPDGGRSRQTSICTRRGISTPWLDSANDKVQFLHADTSLPTLGLSPANYDLLRLETGCIVHNAWPVNFHYGAEGFAPAVAGTRHLFDLAASARKKVPLVFVSSRGAVEGWNVGSDGPVPEAQVPDLDIAVLAYGRAKAVGSLVLDAGCEASGVPCASIRLGQIAGPEGPLGEWNAVEWLPSLIKSSVQLGVLPGDLGSMSMVDWVPVEAMAGIILDVSGVTSEVEVDEIKGYFHAVNPELTRWEALVPAVMEVYSSKIKNVVGFEEWISILEQSSSGKDGSERNPALKLLDTYKGFLQTQKASRGFVTLSTTRTIQRSPTMRNLKAITPELMKRWCRQWGDS